MTSESERPPQALSYTEREVTALLDLAGGRLYLYFCVMLGNDVAAARALGDTIIAALPGTSYRRLLAVARTVCWQYRCVPAASDARPGVPSLSAVTIAALLRLDQEDREICVLGAPRYRLNDPDLAAILRTPMVASLRSQASARFGRALEACATDAGLGVSEDLPARALRMFGSDPVTLPYDQIVPLATDPALEGIREGIRGRVALPAEAAPVAERPMEALGTQPRTSINAGPLASRPSRAIAARPNLAIASAQVLEAKHLTVPLHGVLAKAGRRSAGWCAVVGACLVAGAIPVAIAGGALAGHSAHQGRDPEAGPQLAVPGAWAPHAVASPGGVRHTPRPVRSVVPGAPASSSGALPPAAPALPSATTSPAPVFGAPSPSPTTPARLPSPTTPPPPSTSPTTPAPPSTSPTTPPPLPTPSPSTT